MKKLGILGGMGPAATATLFSRIVDLTDASVDQDHIDITILNVPSVPDRTEFILRKPGAQPFVPILQDMARTLEDMGCEILIMPCNAAHTKHDEISSVLRTSRLLNILEETAAYAKKEGYTCAGILATDGTVASGSYQEAFDGVGMTSVIPSDPRQRDVMSAIYDYVKSGVEAPTDILDGVCEELIDGGADCLILGCTELGVLDLPESYKGVSFIDSIDALAFGAIEACGARVKHHT